ncbi:MAG TPA: nitroreductase family protein [Xanthobacteraceae bacterium]|jgi:nitroreductase|nr:nitroreductase family protein [Xanthobacteraceae bacterium]
MADDTRAIEAALAARFGEKLKVDCGLPGLDELARIAGHRSQRYFQPRAIAPDLLKLLCACALSAPSKSDLQQCDIVVVSDQGIRQGIVATIPDMPWIMDAPVFLVFVGNGARLPEIAKLRDKPFPNDHLDQFFNAAVDAAIVMAMFIRAAEAVGLGCCPISAIRDRPQIVSDLLRLPQRVVPVAGLCVGWPAQEGEITPRLSLATTVVENAYGERNLAGEIDAYDRRRAQFRPYRRQRDVARWGEAPFYGWSEDKARQYAEPTRTDFGGFVRGKGFRLD